MEEKNRTALVSCFARCYHYKKNKYRIFSDTMAGKMLSEEEYNKIALNMVNGIQFFNPNFKGSKEEALRWIVDNQLSPSVLGRSAFCEKALANAIQLGCREYLILASGYDTFAYRNNIENLKVFEIDKPEMIEDKIKRLSRSGIDYTKVNFIKCDFTDKNWIIKIKNSNYDESKLTFSSLLGISYYITKEEFAFLIQNLSTILCDGSSIVFDYPTYNESEETKRNEKLAKQANEEMKAKYTYKEIESVLEKWGFLIYEHLDDKEITNTYFEKFNLLNPNHKIIAPQGVSYCLAVKKNIV